MERRGRENERLEKGQRRGRLGKVEGKDGEERRREWWTDEGREGGREEGREERRKERRNLGRKGGTAAELKEGDKKSEVKGREGRGKEAREREGKEREREGKGEGKGKVKGSILRMEKDRERQEKGKVRRRKRKKRRGGGVLNPWRESEWVVYGPDSGCIFPYPRL